MVLNVWRDFKRKFGKSAAAAILAGGIAPAVRMPVPFYGTAGWLGLALSVRQAAGRPSGCLSFVFAAAVC